MGNEVDSPSSRVACVKKKEVSVIRMLLLGSKVGSYGVSQLQLLAEIGL